MGTLWGLQEAALVDEQPAVSHDPTALSQECVNPKVEPTQVEVEDVVEEEEIDDDVTLPALMDRDGPDSDSDSDDEDDDDIAPAAEGSYMNSRGLRRYNRERTQPMYTKVAGTGKKYAETPKGKEGPMDSYNSFLTKGVINMNTGDAEDYKMSDDEVNHHIVGVFIAQHFSLKAGLKKFNYLGRKQLPKSYPIA